MTGPFDPRKEAHLLSGYVDGELGAEDAARVEAHLAEDPAARQEVERLRKLKDLTGAMRLKEPPPEAWEVFWASVYNRAERSVGWILLALGLAVVGGWAALQLIEALFFTDAVPLVVRLGVMAGLGGLVLLVVSVVRERIFKRNRTRYKNVIR